jgi:hypothetical protein
VKWTDEEENNSLGYAQELGRTPQSKIPGFCRHKVACPFSLLFVEVGGLKSPEENERNFGKLSY